MKSKLTLGGLIIYVIKKRDGTFDVIAAITTVV